MGKVKEMTRKKRQDFQNLPEENVLEGDGQRSEKRAQRLKKTC